MDREELKNITIAYVLLLAMFAKLQPKLMVYYALPLFTAFVMHEYGHIMMGKHLGHYARFELWKQGIIFSLGLFVLSFGQFIFAALGYAAIYPTRWMTEDENFLISVAGPAVNLANAIIFYLLYMITGYYIFLYTVVLNAWIGFFNLLPIQPLDGATVIKRPVIWGIMFAIFGFMAFAL
jgi:Zn-dependent protease